LHLLLCLHLLRRQQPSQRLHQQLLRLRLHLSLRLRQHLPRQCQPRHLCSLCLCRGPWPGRPLYRLLPPLPRRLCQQPLHLLQLQWHLPRLLPHLRQRWLRRQLLH